MATKFKYKREPDIRRRFRYFLETIAELEQPFADDDRPIDKHDRELARFAREVLVAIDSNDFFGAVYAAFRFGSALNNQNIWRPRTNKMLLAKQAVIPNERFMKKMVNQFNQLKKEHPDWKNAKIEKEVQNRGGPSPRTLRRWRKIFGA